MTRRMLPVSAQWALEGKQPDGQDYRILACSTGNLNRNHFAAALSRFQLGELNTLPQVSVSYAKHGAAQSYVALAIHWYADEGQRYADGVEQRDNQGRPTAYTNYFCLPYKHLAAAAIGYLAMYKALCAVRLTVADGPPLDVPIPMPTSRTPAADDLAVCVAPLLLTGRPVCVLGAEGTSMLERLEFIDTVMELLPYGFRSRMTAATWTRATNRNHHFRLFFSSAPRADEPDHVVAWGESPDLVGVADKEAEYLEWLQEHIGPLAHLADLTNEMGFSAKGTNQAVESALGMKPRFQPRPVVRVPDARQHPLPPPQPNRDSGEEALYRCAEYVNQQRPASLRSRISFLKKFAEGDISDNQRVRYRDLITRLRLFQPDLPIDDRQAERLYSALLPMAFGIPLNYDDYCRVEWCAGVVPGQSPHTELLEAIVKTEIAEPSVRAIANWHLLKDDQKKLAKWLASGQVNAVQLIGLLARDWPYPQHAQVVCDVTLEYLAREPTRYDPSEIRRALGKHAFLARALQLRHPADDQYQVNALHGFLKAAFPIPARTPGQDISPGAIVEILNTGYPPTPALLTAVLMLLDRPENWQLAWSAYIRGSLTLPSFDEPTLALMRSRLPQVDAAAVSPARQQPDAGAGFAQWGPDSPKPVEIWP
jgi:hypothetical protein